MAEAIFPPVREETSSTNNVCDRKEQAGRKSRCTSPFRYEEGTGVSLRNSKPRERWIRFSADTRLAPCGKWEDWVNGKERSNTSAIQRE